MQIASLEERLQQLQKEMKSAREEFTEEKQSLMKLLVGPPHVLSNVCIAYHLCCLLG